MLERIPLVERLSGGLGRSERAMRPDRLEVVGIHGSRCVELHEEHLVERRPEHSKGLPVEKGLALSRFEGRGEEGGRRVVQPLRRQTVALGDTGDSLGELPVDTCGTVDVASRVRRPCQASNAPPTTMTVCLGPLSVSSSATSPRYRSMAAAPSRGSGTDRPAVPPQARGVDHQPSCGELGGDVVPGDRASGWRLIGIREWWNLTGPAGTR